jgi:hypothetical protein
MQDRCTVYAERTIGLEIVLDAPMEVLVTRLKWKLVSLYLETVLVLVQEWCTICAKHTTGSKVILDAPDRIPM